MSLYTAERVAADIHDRPAYLGPMILGADGRAAHVDGTAGLNVIRLLASCDASAEITQADHRRLEILSAYGYGVPVMIPDKPFVFYDGVAIIPIHGTLINRFPYSWGWVTGYDFIRNQVAAASADDDVKLIVYDINSCGGTCAGCQETADVMFASRDIKPSVAVVDSSAYSAAYFLASQASKVLITPSGNLGGIGCIALRLDISGMLAQSGVKVSMIYAGAFKTDGYPYESMSEGEKERAQKSVDYSYGMFVAAVARGRGLPEETIRATEAGCYNSADAVTAKLADAVAAPGFAVNDARCLMDSDDEDIDDSEDDTQLSNHHEDAMPKETPVVPTQETSAVSQDALLAAATEARTAERTRIQGITSCDEAKGKPKLAAHLATATDMTVDQAKAALSAAAPEVVEAVRNPLDGAMERNGGAGVQAGSEAKPGDGTDDKVARILANQTLVTGRTHVAKAA